MFAQEVLLVFGLELQELLVPVEIIFKVDFFVPLESLFYHFANDVQPVDGVFPEGLYFFFLVFLPPLYFFLFGFKLVHLFLVLLTVLFVDGLLLEDSSLDSLGLFIFAVVEEALDLFGYGLLFATTLADGLPGGVRCHRHGRTLLLAAWRHRRLL